MCSVVWEFISINNNLYINYREVITEIVELKGPQTEMTRSWNHVVYLFCSGKPRTKL